MWKERAIAWFEVIFWICLEWSSNHENLSQDNQISESYGNTEMTFGWSEFQTAVLRDEILRLAMSYHRHLPKHNSDSRQHATAWQHCLQKTREALVEWPASDRNSNLEYTYEYMARWSLKG